MAIFKSMFKKTGYIKIGSQPEEKGPSVPDGMWLKCSKCKNGLSGRCKRKVLHLSEMR